MMRPVSENAGQDILRGVAMAVLAFSLSVFLPIVGFVFALFIPLPVLFYRVKGGRKSGAVVAAVSGALMALLLGGPAWGDGLFFGGLLLLGLALGDGIDRGMTVERTFLMACGLVLGGGTTLVLFHAGLSGVDLAPFVSDYIRGNLELSLRLYGEMGVPPEQIEAVRSVLDVLHRTLVRLLPALIVSSTMLVAWATLIMALQLFRIRGVAASDPGPLNRWRAPDPLIWGVIGCGVLLMFPDAGLKLAGLNGLIVLLTVYFFGGIAVVSYFFEKRRLPLALRFLL